MQRRCSPTSTGTARELPHDGRAHCAVHAAVRHLAHQRLGPRTSSSSGRTTRSFAQAHNYTGPEDLAFVSIAPTHLSPSMSATHLQRPPATRPGAGGHRRLRPETFRIESPLCLRDRRGTASSPRLGCGLEALEYPRPAKAARPVGAGHVVPHGCERCPARLIQARPGQAACQPRHDDPLARTSTTPGSPPSGGTRGDNLAASSPRPTWLSPAMRWPR
jgi:hypothetical protein